MPVRALEFFCGIGGLHLAFLRSGVEGSVVQAFDWDQSAYQVYVANFPTTNVTRADVSTLSAATIMAYTADLWLLSPACQPYTVLNPNARGASDPRAKSFLHLIQVLLPDLAATNAHPSRLLVENVAGFESSDTRQTILTTLQSLGYVTLELLITPLQFGIPNSRLRYYLLAKRKPLDFCHVPVKQADSVWRYIPGSTPWADSRSPPSNAEPSSTQDAAQPVPRRVRDYLDEYCSSGMPHPNAIPDKVLEKWGFLFDIVLPSSRRTCCFTRGYSQLVERSGSILQMNESLDTTRVFEIFLNARSLNEEAAVQILHPLGLRYFSSTELLRFFDFTSIDTEAEFFWPNNISTKTRYRLIGNSVNVKVVESLITYLFQEERQA